MILRFSLHYPLILSSIHFYIDKKTVVSPLHNIYYYLLYNTLMMPTLTTDSCINIQIELMIIISVLNYILVSG